VPLLASAYAAQPERHSENDIMMQIDCPFCGRRDETEFSYGGEAHLTRPTFDVDDKRWADYLFFRDNVKGVHAERWRHARGCGQWFNAVRNTATHHFLAVYRATEPQPSTVAELQAGVAAGTRGSTSTTPPLGASVETSDATAATRPAGTSAETSGATSVTRTPGTSAESSGASAVSESR
jgi:sarcosine oxidase subunit delta